MLDQGDCVVGRRRMAPERQSRQQTIKYAREEAARCADLAEKAGSAQSRAVYNSLREAWIRIANSLESAEVSDRGSKTE
jgi:hypothetical protein